MNCLRSTHWIQFGLAISTISLASTVNAATLEGYPGAVTAWEVFQQFTSPDSASRAITIPPVATDTSVVSEEILVAQITPDDTLGAEASVVTPDVTIKENPADLIEGGAVRGSNLFHSFQEFNVNTGQRIYFANPSSIENILSRVTGGDVTDIDGLLGVDGSANLFLLNPNGIIFGPNARLDISGSLTASTGESWTFEDGSEFSAVNPQGAELLSISVPLGVQYGVTPPAISSSGNLTVGGNLTLTGGSVTSNGQLESSSGQLIIEGVTQDIVLQDGTTLQAGNDVVLQAENDVLLQNSSTLQSEEDLRLQAGNTVKVSESALLGEGQLLVHAEQSIDISNSTLSSERDMMFSAPVRQLGEENTFTTGGYFVTEDASGNVIDFLIPHDRLVLAKGNVRLDDVLSGSSLYVLAGGSVTVGDEVTDIRVNAGGSGSITEMISDGTGGTQQVTVNASDRPTLDIRAGVDWESLGGLPTASTVVGTVTPIDPGGALSSDITIAGNVRIEQPDGQVVLSNRFQPDSGLVEGAINTQLFEPNTLSKLSQTTEQKASAGAPAVEQPPGSIFVGSINTSSTTGGKGGSIILEASGNIKTTGFFENPVNQPIALGSFSLSENGNTEVGGKISLSSFSGNITTGALGSFSASNSGNAESGGNISLSSNSGNITTNSLLDSTSSSNSGNAGSGGNISLTSNAGDIVTNGGLVSLSGSRSGNGGNGGNISLSSNSGNITTNSLLDSSSGSRSGNGGNGGSISLSSNSGNITTNSLLDSRSSSNSGNAGDGGNISLFSNSGSILINEGLVSSSESNSGTAGDGGIISLSSNSGDIDFGDIDFPRFASSQAVSESGNAGNGGNISFSSNSGDITIFSNSFTSESQSESGNAGDGGNISLSSVSGDIDFLGFIRSEAVSESGTGGNGGNISLSSNSGDITTRDLFSSSFSNSGHAGNGGNISLSSNSGDITTSALNSSSFSIPDNVENGGDAGNGGFIFLSSELGNITTESLNSFSFSESGNSDNGGVINLLARNGIVRGENAQINSFSATEEGGMTNAGGTVTIETNSISNFEISTFSSAGESGNFQIRGFGDSLLVRDLSLTTSVQTEITNPFTGKKIPVNLRDIGQSGNTFVSSAGDLNLDNVRIQSDANGSQPAGGIIIKSPGQITLNNSQINSNANNSNGNAGNIEITAGEGITIQGLTSAGEKSGIFARTISNGQGGSITLNTSQLTLADTAAIEATTSTKARGGTLTFNAPNALTIQGMGQVRVDTTSKGRAGDLIVNAPSVFIDGTELSASTNGAGQGGNVALNLSQLTFANDGQISASTSGKGSGGSLTLQNSVPLRIEGAGRLAVEGQGATSGPSGELKVIAPSVILDNWVTLSASTESQQGGGNVIFEVDDALLLRRNSFINAEATNAIGGSAGSIDIDAGFVIAVPSENSDIIANAVGGTGGIIDITTNRLLGFTEQNVPTTEQLRANFSSDISASSQFGQQGEITINTLELDPNQGLLELPTLSPPPQIQRGCSVGTVGTSSFIVTGRGGLPPRPTDILSRDRLLTDLGPETSETVGKISVNESSADFPEPILEAQGLVKGPDGRTFFVAQTPNASSPQGTWQPSVECSGSVSNSREPEKFEKIDLD